MASRVAFQLDRIRAKPVGIHQTLSTLLRASLFIPHHSCVVQMINPNRTERTGQGTRRKIPPLGIFFLFRRQRQLHSRSWVGRAYCFSLQRVVECAPAIASSVIVEAAAQQQMNIYSRARIWSGRRVFYLNFIVRLASCTHSSPKAHTHTIFIRITWNVYFSVSSLLLIDLPSIKGLVAVVVSRSNRQAYIMRNGKEDIIVRSLTTFFRFSHSR